MRKTIAFLLILLTQVFVTVSAQTTPPANVTIETWHINYTMTSANYGTVSDTETIDVAFSGADAYFFFPNPLNGGGWVKGQIDSSVATFPSGQSMGKATHGGQDIFFCGVDASNNLCDVTFDYDETKKVFTLHEGIHILVNASATQPDPWAYFSVATVSKETIDPDNGNDIGEDGRVVVPQDATTKDYMLTGQNVNPNNEEQYENLNETVKVAFKGTSIYIQGLCAYDPSAWIKGTVNGNTATFAKRQYVTSYGGKKLYMTGYNGSECDIVFNYSSETGSLQTDTYILCITEEGYTYQLLKNLMLIQKNGNEPDPEPVKPDVVTPPEDLQTDTYQFSATLVGQDYDGSWVQEPISYNVRMGFSGVTVYIQGMSVYLPDAWIKGTRNASDGEMTFASGQYYGEFTPEGTGYHFDLYFAAANYPTSSPSWIDEATFSYNQSTASYNCRQLLLLNISGTKLAPLEFYAGAKLTKVETDPAGIDATNSKAQSVSERFTDLQGRSVSPDSRGLLLKTTRMSDGTVHTIKVLRK